MGVAGEFLRTAVDIAALQEQLRSIGEGVFDGIAYRNSGRCSRPDSSRPPEPLAETGQASFIQQHSSILWIKKSLKQPPLAQRNPWNFWIW